MKEKLSTLLIPGTFLAGTTLAVSALNISIQIKPSSVEGELVQILVGGFGIIMFLLSWLLVLVSQKMAKSSHLPNGPNKISLNLWAQEEDGKTST